MLHFIFSSIYALSSSNTKWFGLLGKKLSKYEPFKSYARDFSDYIAEHWLTILWVGILLLLLFCLWDQFATAAYCRNEKENKDEYESAKRGCIVLGIICILWLVGGLFALSYKSNPQITISSLWVEHDVTQNGQKGCVVHLNYEAENVDDGTLTAYSELFEGNKGFDASIMQKKTKRGERIISASTSSSRKAVILSKQDFPQGTNVAFFFPYTSAPFAEGNHYYNIQCEVKYVNGNDSTETYKYTQFNYNYNKPRKKVASERKSNNASNPLYDYYFGGTYDYNYSSGSTSILEESSSSDSYSKCHDCHGSGNCRHCNGTGRSILTGYSEMCVVCNGSGQCKQCFGSGRI